MRWNAFVIAHNEEKFIKQTIHGIKNQTIAPEKIYVVNDGSTDSTGRVLETIPGLLVKHVPPHPPNLASDGFWDKRNALMKEASRDADYMLSMDADIILTNDYIERITERMKRDEVKVACGLDPDAIRLIPPEPGLVVNVPWFLKSTARLPSNILAIHSLLDGYRSGIYHSIKLASQRKTGANYNAELYRYRGVACRRYGYSPLHAVERSVHYKTTRFLRGYIAGGKEKMQHPSVRRWIKKWEQDRIRVRLGLKPKLLQKIDDVVYIIPTIGWE